jgi:hypothetical protein
VLDDDELAELRGCRVDACDINLSPAEIRRMQASIGHARDWKAAARKTFAEILAARAAKYVDDTSGAQETFLYWSKERLGRQPMISVTHVAMIRDGAPGRPEVVIISTNVFATRYIDTSVSVTVLTAARDGSRRYLAYINRTDVDAVGGVFGGIVRWLVERRLKSDAEEMLPQLRRRLERGDPDDEGSEFR